ncbi:MAG: HlyD family efflux transporter periplasmic adaptor subunit, partial [Bacillota bacterium]
VTAPFGGVVGTVEVQAGDRVASGDALAGVITTKVYAPTAGEVTGVFAQAGDAVDSAVTRYGAVLYLTPAHKFTFSADSSKAYGTNENMYVHLGEVVYLRSYNLQIYNTGMGVITAVSGESFTVESTQGEFWMGETLSIYREASYASTSRIGRGDVTRTAEVAVSGSGSILAMHVQDGEAVARGQLLYETVTGGLEGLIPNDNQIPSPVAGIVESVGVSAGNSLEKGALVAMVCPIESMQVLIEINEYDLMDIKVGDPVSLTFSYDDRGLSPVEGTVEMISDISFSTDTSNVTYNAYIDFAPNENIRLGMTVMVNILDGQEEEAADTQEEPMPAQEGDGGDFMPMN